MGILAFAVLLRVAFLLYFYCHPVAPEVTNSTTNITEYKCRLCVQGQCLDTNTNTCLLSCTRGCNDGYYTSNLVEVHTCEYEADVPETRIDDRGLRRKRQNTVVPTTTPQMITTPTTTSTTTPSTTPAVEKWICKKCSLTGCKKCIDEVEEPGCELCLEGYLLSNTSYTCAEIEDKPPAGRIAGIVIGTLCVVGIVIVIAVIVFKRFHGSRNDSVRIESMKPKRNDGGRHGSKSPQIPKISTKDLLRKHDQIMHNSKDPTSKNTKGTEETLGQNVGSERKEVEELGLAPSPPDSSSKHYVAMQNSRYDRLEVKNEHEHQSYSPLKFQQDDLYLNTGVIAKEDMATESVYANTQQMSSAGITSSNQLHDIGKPSVVADNRYKGSGPMISQESVELYEPVGTNSPIHDTQEIYLNDESAMLVQHSEETTEEIYVNEGQDITDDVYENT